MSNISSAGAKPSAGQSRGQGIDYNACLLKGLIGGVGCIPSQCASHPFDVIKIRMQTRSETFGAAFHGIKSCASFPVIGRQTVVSTITPFYRGFLPAVEQRMVTRTPMFLVSELFTQLVYNNTNWSKTVAVFIGSVGSGFTTGILAGVAEYRKKLLSQGIVSAKEARWLNLYKTARSHGTLPWIGRRLLAAGICSATYDSVFFGTEHYLSNGMGCGPALSYGLGAVSAVTCAFAFDSVVARMMVVPPQAPCLSFSQTFSELFAADHNKGIVGVRRVIVAHRGISARAVEFFINYSITGFTSVYVVLLFTKLMGKSNTIDA